MKNLLYKEFKLAIHPLIYIASLLGVLILIPHWLYFIALSYVFFISISNFFSTCKAQNDIGFSLMLPVKKRDIVKVRFISVAAIEMIHIAIAVIFAIINSIIYPFNHAFMDPNAAFFGFVFIMYAIFNSFFLPMFYKTAYKIGLPVIIGTIFALLFAVAVEWLISVNPLLNTALDSSESGLLWKLVVLALGIIIFLISMFFSYKVSAKRFERLDL